jgi:TPR repeat protein
MSAERLVDMASRGEAALQSLMASQRSVKDCLTLGVAEIERKANEGDTTAMIARGDACLGGKADARLDYNEFISNVPAAEHWYQRAYDADHSIISIHRLAGSLGYRKYMRRAAELYEEGAQRGCCCAAYRVASIKSGEGWADAVEVRRLFERAVALGDLAARGRLANMLLYGKGGPIDVWRALRLLTSLWKPLVRLADDDPRRASLE